MLAGADRDRLSRLPTLTIGTIGGADCNSPDNQTVGFSTTQSSEPQAGTSSHDRSGECLDELGNLLKSQFNMLVQRDELKDSGIVRL